MHSQPGRGTSMKTGSASSVIIVVVVVRVMLIEEVVIGIVTEEDVEGKDVVVFFTVVLGVAVSFCAPMQPQAKTKKMTANTHVCPMVYGFG